MYPKQNADISLSKRSSHSCLPITWTRRVRGNSSTGPIVLSLAFQPHRRLLICLVSVSHARSWKPSLLPYLRSTTTFTHYEAYIIMTNMPPSDNTANTMLSPRGETILRKPKKLIVCCDGTWMDSDSGWVDGHLQTPSNVTRIARAIKTEDSHSSPQIVYYQAGVGTGIGFANQILGGGTAQHANTVLVSPNISVRHTHF
ncbi:hypothetical protein BDV97DRAFT_212177 [Delphinella strobiligena]|nr:hypothetical protein BDV97DRAFT_212177 [Delphinella strobiligena]